MSGLGQARAVLASLLMLGGDGPDPIDELDRDGVASRERQRRAWERMQQAEGETVARAEEKRQRRAAKRLRDAETSELGRAEERAFSEWHEACRRRRCWS